MVIEGATRSFKEAFCTSIYRVNESLRRGPAIDSHKRMILHFCLSTSNWNESA